MACSGRPRALAQHGHGRERGAEGAANLPHSRHIHADGADFFLAQVTAWVQKSPKLTSRDDVLKIANAVFADGGLGNENSGTLHVDARGIKARFVTWTAVG